MSGQGRPSCPAQFPGFGEHPHRDMEIMTFIVDGFLTHKAITSLTSSDMIHDMIHDMICCWILVPLTVCWKWLGQDSHGNEETLGRGGVQFMTAGQGCAMCHVPWVMFLVSDPHITSRWKGCHWCCGSQTMPLMTRNWHLPLRAQLGERTSEVYPVLGCSLPQAALEVS